MLPTVCLCLDEVLLVLALRGHCILLLDHDVTLRLDAHADARLLFRLPLNLGPHILVVFLILG